MGVNDKHEILYEFWKGIDSIWVYILFMEMLSVLTYLDNDLLLSDPESSVSKTSRVEDERQNWILSHLKPWLNLMQD